jgi:ABC-type multidrug transport system fused ATPase/permease subunit
VLPLVYKRGQNRSSLGLTGIGAFEIFIDESLKPGQDVRVRVTNREGDPVEFSTTCRIDTPVEVAERADAQPLAEPRGSIRFQDVSFRYAGDTPVLGLRAALGRPYALAGISLHVAQISAPVSGTTNSRSGAPPRYL